MKTETRNEAIKQCVFLHLYLGSGQIKKIEDMKPEHNLIEDYGADSLDQIELIMEMEEMFDCEINDDDAEKIDTLGKMFEYAEEHNLKTIESS